MSDEYGGKKYPPMKFGTRQGRVKKEKADRVVNNKSQLIDAVGHPKTIIWIPEDVTINMTGETGIKIEPHVTIASNRNIGGKGGMIKTDGYDDGIFKNTEGGFRLTGVRLQGPRMDYFDPGTSDEVIYDYSAVGFRAYGPSVIVDNCEVFGWTGAGFTPGTRDLPTRGWFHHNAMHHNQMAHLGYPMDLLNGLHLIEWNYFDANRHSIAAFGYDTNGYEARFNVVGPHAVLFAFDMHRLGENIGSGPNANSIRGGKFVNIHHNVFELDDHNAFSIQGKPTKYARFVNNWCAHTENGNDAEAVSVWYPEKLRMKKNKYGPQSIKPGRLWLKKLSAQLSGSGKLPGPPKPSPSKMNIDLSIRETPHISTTTTSKQTATTTPSKQTSMVNPLTGTPLTPAPGNQ